MKIKNIKIDNFRGIRQLEMHLGDRVNVVVGENGAGKSSVLTALRYLMSCYVAKVMRRDGKGISIKEGDVAKGAGFCRLEIELDNGVRWKLVKRSSQTREKSPEKTDLSQLTTWADDFVMDLSLDEVMKGHKVHYPVVAHYGVNRAVADVEPKLRKKSKTEATDAYEIRLNNGANFEKFFDWFREREDIENEAIVKDGKATEDVQLQAVRRALSQIFPGYTGFHVNRKQRAFLLRKGEQELRIDQLSDGEKCYMTLVGDIARMLAMTNEGNDTPLNGSGCILIDEVDLHLHPQWQTEVMPRLAAIFPNCQFIVTTHSPFVVSSVQTTGIDRFFVMRDGEANEVDANIFGRSVELILTDFFQMNSLRNAEVQSHIDAVWDALVKGDYQMDTVAGEMKWLEEHLASDDIVFVKFNLEKAKQKRLHEAH